MKQALMMDFRVFLAMRNYAPTTIKSYVNVLGLYWSFCEQQAKTNPQFTKDKAVFLWFKHLTQKHGAGTVFSQNYSSLKLFYAHILKRDWASYDILRPRRGVRPLPEVMTLDEIIRPPPIEH